MNTRSIGFKSESENVIDIDNLLQYVMQDLKSFGLIPELIGRMPVVTFGSIRQKCFRGYSK